MDACKAATGMEWKALVDKVAGKVMLKDHMQRMVALLGSLWKYKEKTHLETEMMHLWLQLQVHLMIVDTL